MEQSELTHKETHCKSSVWENIMHLVALKVRIFHLLVSSLFYLLPEKFPMQNIAADPFLKYTSNRETINGWSPKRTGANLLNIHEIQCACANSQ